MQAVVHVLVRCIVIQIMGKTFCVLFIDIFSVLYIVLIPAVIVRYCFIAVVIAKRQSDASVVRVDIDLLQKRLTAAGPDDQRISAISVIVACRDLHEVHGVEIPHVVVVQGTVRV